MSKARREASEDTIIAALVEADRTTDAAVAERYGVSRGTISDWRARVTADPRLAKKLREERKRGHGWVSETEALDIALSRAIREKVASGEEIPFSYIAAKKTASSALIHAGSLLGDTADDDEEDDGES